MKKLIMLIMCVLVAGLVSAEAIKYISIAAGATSGSWVNDDGRARTYKLGSVFGTLSTGATGADTATVTVSGNGSSFTVDSGTITSNGTTVVVDFADEAYVGWGETVTVTRAANSTNAAVAIMLVIE